MARVDVAVPSDMTPEQSWQLTLSISDDNPGSTFHVLADLSGGVLSGPVGKLVARVLKSDVRKSVENLSRLQSSAPR